MGRRTAGIILAGVTVLAGCEQVEVMVDSRRNLTPHEAYVQGLHDSGLVGTALTRDWLHAAGAALETPLPMEVPFVEEGYFTPEDPMAIGYRFVLERGRTATISLTVEGESDGRVFFDLLRVPEDASNPLRPVEADTTSLGFVYEPGRDGEYVVRVQPELLRGGAYRLEVRLDPALAFPVQGRDMRDAWSQWGAPREGGRRSHEGIDIFAPRGTPVLASVSATVRRANTTPVGGKVVWLRDERMNRSVYYAHLDSQYVSAGDRVEVGDTVGFVGNTGNAISTPPHLHYGLYYRGEGAVDPAPFVRGGREVGEALAVNRELLGGWVRTRDDGIRLHSGPSLDADVVAELDNHAPARVLGGTGNWYRVRLPDGRSGYLAERVTESLDVPVETLLATGERTIVASPEPLAPRVARIAAGASTAVLGRYAGFSMVRIRGGVLGWIVDVDTAADTDR